MKDAILQKELFEEFDKPKKRNMAEKKSILPKSYTMINITYEQIVFISIAILMLMVLVFSLGVERGKHIKAPEVKIIPESSFEIAEIEPVKKSEPIPVAPMPVAVEAAPMESRPYTIQVIAYRSKKLAQEELVKLSKKGFDPFIIVGGGYYQICANEYATHDKAKKDFKQMKRTYKDCFIRKR